MTELETLKAKLAEKDRYIAALQNTVDGLRKDAERYCKVRYWEAGKVSGVAWYVPDDIDLLCDRLPDVPDAHLQDKP